jgi:hypothetical protein
MLKRCRLQEAMGIQQQQLLQQVLPRDTSASDQSAVMSGALHLLLWAAPSGEVQEGTEGSMDSSSGCDTAARGQELPYSYQKDDTLLFFAENATGKRRFAVVASTGHVVVTSGTCPCSCPTRTTPWRDAYLPDICCALHTTVFHSNYLHNTSHRGTQQHHTAHNVNIRPGDRHVQSASLPP